MNIEGIKKFCKENISLIENYEKAINDKTQMWDCHHRLEIELGVSAKQLIKMDLYYNRPASELIFLTHAEHTKLHKSNMREETKKQISESNKGKHRTEETKKKQSEKKNEYYKTHSVWNKGKQGLQHRTEESRKAQSERQKNRKYSDETKQKMKNSALEYYKTHKAVCYIKGMKLMTDGTERIMVAPEYWGEFLDIGYWFACQKNPPLFYIN